MEDKSKLYYDIALSQYNELNEWYSGLNDKASKLLTFITIVSTGILLLVKWVLDNFVNLGPSGGWIISIVVLLLISIVIELGFILYAMFATSISKATLTQDEFESLQSGSLDEGYQALRKKYTTANEENYTKIENKGKSLKNSQIGLTVLLSIITVGISIIFILKYYGK